MKEYFSSFGGDERGGQKTFCFGKRYQRNNIAGKRYPL
jgi:hypothetical protein